jgi:hypothetical protein
MYCIQISATWRGDLNPAVIDRTGRRYLTVKSVLVHQDDLRILREGQAYERYQAAYRLRYGLQNPEVARALVEALADPTFSESAADYDAPPHVYGVAQAALESLQGLTEPPGLAEVMRRSPQAARLGVCLLPQGELLREMLRHPQAEVRTAAVERWGELGGSDWQPLLEALLDQNGQVVSMAMSYARKLPDLAQLAAPQRAVQNMRERPRAGLFVQVVALFQPTEEVLRAWVELAGQGCAEAANQLIRHRALLNYEMVRELPPTAETLSLWGWIGDPRALPLLRAQRERPEAMLALLRLGEASDQVAELFLAQEKFRKAVLAAHPDPARLVQEVVPILKRQWDQGEDLGALRGLEVLAAYLGPEMPWLLSKLKPYSGEPLARQYAIAIVGKLGSQAVPAFEALAVLLDNSDCRGCVLQALAELGPLARADFLPMLLDLKKASGRWLHWQKNWWTEPLELALRSLAKNDPPAEARL